MSATPQPLSSPLRPIGRARPWLLGLAYLLLLAPLSYAPRFSGNVWSRYMTIESLVERHTLRIDLSPLRARSGSPDLIKVDGHFYSDKPPVLSALSTLLYAPLYWSGQRMSGPPPQLLFINWILVLAVAGAGSALAVVGIRLILQAAPLAPWAADLLALAGGLATQLLSYAVTFNNHSVAAGLLTLAFALILTEKKPPTRTRFCAGLLAALAATIDLPAGGAFTAALACWLTARTRRPPVAFLAGCIPPLLLHAALQLSTTGSPLPAELTPEVFNYPGSYWASPEGRWVEPSPRWQFGLELLLGPQGWLTLTPVLALGLVSITLAAARRSDPLRPAALTLATVVAVLVAYYTFGVRRTDFAGQSFGTRHLLAISPLVYAFAIILASRAGRVALWILFAALMAIGLVYALAGMHDPWTRAERRQDPALRWVKPLTLYPFTSYQR